MERRIRRVSGWYRGTSYFNVAKDDTKDELLQTPLLEHDNDGTDHDDIHNGLPPQKIKNSGKTWKYPKGHKLAGD
jgi:hypothetical protein